MRRDLVASRSPGRGGPQHPGELEIGSWATSGIRDAVWERDGSLLARQHRRDRHLAQILDVAVTDERDVAAQVVERQEVVAVDDGGGGSVGGDGDELDGFNGLLVLEQPGSGAVVGAHEAVHDEGAVVGRVAEVAAVRVVLFSVWAGVLEAVVGPLPNPAALQTGVRVEEVHVLLERARPVAHGVRELAQHKRLLPVPGLREVAEGVVPRVHPRPQIDRLGLRIALVMHHPPRIPLLRPLIHLLMIHAVKRLVPQTPHHHARVVLIPLHHLPHAIHIRLLPRRVVARPLRRRLVYQHFSLLIRLPPITLRQRRLLHARKAVRLQIGLIHHPEPQLVGEGVEEGVVRLVARADGVDVVALHEEQVVAQQRLADGPAARRVVLVPVGAAEEDALAVDGEDAVGDGGGAEAGAVGEGLVAEGQDEVVEVRVFGGPFVWGGDGVGGRDGGG